ncbi:tRNA adenosine(34) deaminase TadA [Streptococcus didelphis]|uniref:tRNA-specific adenosine deaminase n=1 Tax=Streptococcus didelphis TaxID=102886 RepID=A0ABY9LFQ4_9STRE|nr:tRNA adenosine(34) deaminase TadA [Streptococcus didelphis]WMB27729.1 tRNA adenosine(34) deaminase TadA [Streptococcus didelphis]WMB29810.1 tRNA adenosine(34) deaminase TadA [Streptococcus didelphis]
MTYSLEEKEYFMRQALKEAEKSLVKNEIPIGCVIVKDGQIIGRGHNAREELNQAIMHAEIMAINQANACVANWRLLDCTLFVTIEPCLMCSGAIGLARIPSLVFGASNEKFGGVVSLYQVLTDERLNHRVKLEGGILAEDCAKIMQDFFRHRRQSKKAKKELLDLSSQE